MNSYTNPILGLNNHRDGPWILPGPVLEALFYPRLITIVKNSFPRGTTRWRPIAWRQRASERTSEKERNGGEGAGEEGAARSRTRSKGGRGGVVDLGCHGVGESLSPSAAPIGGSI